MSTLIDAASDRIDEATKVTVKAIEEEDAARAEWARLMLLAVAEKFPKIEGFTMEITYEYDDEGGYHPTVNLMASGDGWDVGGGWDVQDELIEIENSLGLGGATRLFSSDRMGELTLDQLRGSGF